MGRSIEAIDARTSRSSLRHVGRCLVKSGAEGQIGLFSREGGMEGVGGRGSYVCFEGRRERTARFAGAKKEIGRSALKGRTWERVDRSPLRHVGLCLDNMTSGLYAPLWQVPRPVLCGDG